MPRPRRRRRVFGKPAKNVFKPVGIKLNEVDIVILTIDEFEAVRLKDLNGMDQENASRMMGISQPTFHRLLISARKKIADTIVNAKALKIEGGDYVISGD